MNFNKFFVQIPTQRLVELIKYKDKLQGITIKMQEETYTSGCSAIDLEPVHILLTINITLVFRKDFNHLKARAFIYDFLKVLYSILSSQT